MSKKLISTIVIILVFVIGLVFGLVIKPKASSAPAGSQNTYQAGWNAAEQKLAQSGMIPGLNSNIPIKSISGTVEKIDGNKLTVKTISLNPLADPSTNERIVDVDNGTQFFQMTQKDPQEFQKEMTDFQKTMQSQTANTSQVKNSQTQIQPQTATPPMPFDKKQISLSDIKVGQRISITSGSDLKTAKEFKAMEIDIQSDFSQPAPVAAPNQPAAQSSGVPTSASTSTPTASAPITPKIIAPAPTSTTVK